MLDRKVGIFVNQTPLLIIFNTIVTQKLKNVLHYIIKLVPRVIDLGEV